MGKLFGKIRFSIDVIPVRKRWLRNSDPSRASILVRYQGLSAAYSAGVRVGGTSVYEGNRGEVIQGKRKRVSSAPVEKVEEMS